MNDATTARDFTTIHRPQHHQRFELKPFNSLTVGSERVYLVKGLLPLKGIIVVWGPPKCGKSFWVFDLVMRVSLGWRYRGRRAQKGPVVYCAFEGADGFRARAEAFRQRHLPEDAGPIEFYLVAARANMASDHAELIAAIRAQLTGKPVVLVLDTLNRSMVGSENEPKDMAAYVRAADAVREAFDCAVIIVHHCGIEGSRPRGHTSLTGAADAQLAVKRDNAGNIITTVEWMKDGPEGDRVVSRLEGVDIGTDVDGDTIGSCVVVEAELAADTDDGPRLTPNQKTMFAILHAAGDRGLTLDVWNEKARAAGIGTKRRADLVDVRMALQSKGLIYEHKNGWAVKQ
jgi:hypothetical protein